MAVDYQQLVLPYVPPARCGDVPGTRRPVIVVGAGPVGLTLAIDIARYGTTVLLLDDDDRLSSGSRAICFAKRTLEIWDRLGCGDGIADKGVSWKVGKVHVGERLVYSFDLLPEAGHRRPAFVNLQQYYVEGLLYDHARMALEFENQLNRFAIDNRLKVRMAGGKVILSDSSTPIGSTELVDFYRLFIAIQNNKFSKMFEAVVAQGLMEGLYRHTDPDMQAMMRMYEFVEIDGLLALDVFGERDKPEQAQARSA